MEVGLLGIDIKQDQNTSMNAETRPNNLSVEFEDTEQVQTGILSDELAGILNPIIVFTILPFSVAGIVTNVINIRVFLEQGVRNDSTNIGLVCLSIMDLFNCATLIPFPVCFAIKLFNSLPEHYSCMTFAAIFAFTHAPFQQTGSWITVYISLIRSLCVLFPLKVKLMFTSRTTILYIAFVFSFFIFVQVGYCAFLSFAWVFHPALNTSIATLSDTDTSLVIFYYKQLLSNQILPAVAVVMVSINTLLMGRKLMEVKSWRQKHSNEPRQDIKVEENSNSNKTKPLASKEVELIKLVNTVTSIYLVCVLIGFIPSISVMSLPGVAFGGINENLLYTLFQTRFLFDAVNSSVNLFFYMRVSSRYKDAFGRAFQVCCSPTGGQTDDKT